MSAYARLVACVLPLFLAVLAAHATPASASDGDLDARPAHGNGTAALTPWQEALTPAPASKRFARRRLDSPFRLAGRATPPAASWAQTADENLELGRLAETGGADGGDLAKTSQNPVGDLISLPIQNNTDFGIGPFGRTRNVANIQPVIPIDISCKWRLITRTILPVTLQPDVDRATGSTFGLGDLNPTVWLTPAKPKAIMWGVGTVTFLPTATDTALGTGKWSVGPSVVLVATPGKFVMGALASNFWSFAGDSSRPDVNGFFSQIFINYNLPHGWFLTSAPIITANWEAAKGEKWTVPVGGGIGRVTKFGRRPVSLTAQAYYNVERPTLGPDWQLRLQIAFLFPK